MSNIHCTDFHRLLEAAVESRRPAEVQLREHAASCAQCRPAWEEYLLVEDALLLWKDAAPEVDLIEPVLAKLAYDVEHSTSTYPADEDTTGSIVEHPVVANTTTTASAEPVRKRLKLAPLFVSGIAAAVMAAVFLAPHGENAPGDAIAEKSNVNDRSDDAVGLRSDPDEDLMLASVGSQHSSEQAEFSSAVRDAGTAYLGLASGAAEAVTQGAVLLTPTSTNASSVKAGDRSQPSWVDRVRNEVTPLGERLEGALDFLMETFPSEPTPTT